MGRIKYKRKIRLSKKRKTFIIFILIFLNTFIFFLSFINKLSENIELAAKKEIKEITANLVIQNITKEKLQEITVESLIVVNKNKNEEITDVDFKLDKAYEVMLDIKGILEKQVKEMKQGNLPHNTTAIKNNLVLKIPYYVATDNMLLMNLGPKIYVKINLLENVIGDVYTKITSYGINTILINLYIKLYIRESLLYPVKSEDIEQHFEILVATKVIQGKIPSFYNGILESSSSLINTQ